MSNSNHAPILLSIIVPVYNAEKYISTCLDSLLEQDIDKSNYEIICINDGSTDSSLSILQSYSQKHPNIRLIDKPNGGVASARNLGLEVSQGQYVWFIDADDWIARNCLGVIIRTIIQHHPSIMQLQYDYIKADWRIKECINANLCIEQVSCTSNTEPLPYDGAWSSIIARSLLRSNNHQFILNLHYGEDILFMRELLDIMRIDAMKNGVSHTIVHCLGDIFYYYRQHDESAMNTHWTKNRTKYMEALLGMAHINQERMNDETKPTWYRDQYTSLFYHRMYTYMMHWLPAECSDLKKQLQYLKQEHLYPCPVPPKQIIQEFIKSESFMGKIKNLYRYFSFRYKFLYSLHFAIMKRKYAQSPKSFE